MFFEEYLVCIHNATRYSIIAYMYVVRMKQIKLSCQFVNTIHFSEKTRESVILVKSIKQNCLCVFKMDDDRNGI